MRWRSRFACVLLLVLLAPQVGAGEERWYILMMQDQRAGWLKERTAVEEGRVVTESETKLTLKRDETSITVEYATRFVETDRGEAVEMSARTALGGPATLDEYRFGPGGVLWRHTQGGRTREQTLPAPEGRWLPPAGASEYLASRLEAGAERITVRTLDPLSGLTPVVTTRSGFERAVVEVMGRSVEAIRCETTSSLAPDAVGIEFIDEQGRLLRSETRIGAWTIVVLAADRRLALSPLDPPELMKSVFVRPSRSISDPYRARRGSYILSATSGTLPDLPGAGTQRVERLDGGRARLVRDLDTAPSEAGEVDTGPLLASSAMIGCDDPRVLELTRQALGGAPRDPAERGERLRRFVHRHIRTKDLSVGFASAAEVARTREGDCTEHAVLLAAMLRGDGIPARVVSGLVYVERFGEDRDLFGYHMWTQALLESGGARRWIDLDATLPDATAMTATHLALSVSPLSDDQRINALVEMAPLMGRLAIEVERVE
jgi:hypothetical protein